MIFYQRILHFSWNKKAAGQLEGGKLTNSKRILFDLCKKHKRKKEDKWKEKTEVNKFRKN